MIKIAFQSRLPTINGSLKEIASENQGPVFIREGLNGRSA
jgi:hypothetical protein